MVINNNQQNVTKNHLSNQPKSPPQSHQAGYVPDDPSARPAAASGTAGTAPAATPPAAPEMETVQVWGWYDIKKHQKYGKRWENSCNC